MSSWQLVDNDDDGFRSVTAESSSERALPDEQPLVERSPLAGESSPWPQAGQPLWPQPSSPHAAQLADVFPKNQLSHFSDYSQHITYS